MTKMFERFDKVCKNYKPNNICIKECHHGIDDIIRGTTPEHFLTLPFDVTKDVQKLTVTYKQGINVLIKKHLNTISYYLDNPHVIYYQLTEEETKRFKAIPNSPIKIQVKALLANGDVVTSDIYMIHCLPALDENLMEEKIITRPGDVEIVDKDTDELMYVIPYDSDIIQ